MRRSSEQFLNTFKSVLPEVASTYDGHAVFAPLPTEVEKHLDTSRAMLYHGGTSYERKLEIVTGLQVVAKNCIVLGNPDSVTPPSPMPEHLQEMIDQAKSLPDEERARLISELAQSPNKEN